MRIHCKVFGGALALSLIGGICISYFAPAAAGAAAAGPAGDATGTQAHRIADCLERFGVNTFSKLNRNGYPWSWGGSKGQYEAATTARAINYIRGGSGLTLQVREYHDGQPGGPANPAQCPQRDGQPRHFAATVADHVLIVPRISHDTPRCFLHYGQNLCRTDA